VTGVQTCALPIFLRRQCEVWPAGRLDLFPVIGVWKMVPEPFDGSFEVQAVQVHRKVDGPSAADPLTPVHKFHAGDGDRPLLGVPLYLVVAIPFGSGKQEHGLQGNAPDAIGSISDLLEGHGSWLSFGLRLMQFLMLLM